MPDAFAALRSSLADAVLPAWAGRATQPVWGEGRRGAALMMVGEQPGDDEDLAGRPFVGPAGRLLDRAAAEAGIDRARAYVTNAVKHFKFIPAGKRRLHQKPDAGDIAYYKPFLEREVALVAPRLRVARGGTAASALAGRKVAVLRERGRNLPGPGGVPVFVTVHPSFLLRQPDARAKAREYAAFVADLRAAAALAA